MGAALWSSLAHLGVRTPVSALKASHDDLVVSKGRGEQADGWESLRLDANYFCERACG